MQWSEPRASRPAGLVKSASGAAGSRSLTFDVRATMKKRLPRILMAVAAVFAVAWFAVPRPIEGYWITDSFAILDGEHQFLRFADGHVYFYDPWTPPKYFGTYRKTGWNTYIWGEDAISRFPGKKVV
jgi:hypothetical protein